MASKIFISHSSKDRRAAETICSALEHRGIGCWIASRDIGPGENFQEAIIDAIGAAKVMILVFSSNANNSNEIKKELVIAGQNGLIVIPVRVEDVVLRGALAYELATRQWIDLFSDWEDAVDRLARKLNSVSPAGAPASAKVNEPAPAPAPRPASMQAEAPTASSGTARSAAFSTSRLQILALAAIVALGGLGLGIWWASRPEMPVKGTVKPPDSPPASAAAEPTTGLVGGTPAAAGAWPSLTALFNRNYSATTLVCGAVLIDAQWALTSGICADRHDPQSLFIREGSNVAGNGAPINVTRIIVHERYSFQGVPTNDLALLQLAAPARSPGQILISDRQRAELLKPDAVSTVVGFDHPEAGAAARLAQLDLPLLGSEQCAKMTGRPIADINFCAFIAKPGQGACLGTAGGPVYVRDAANRPVAAGIVSWAGLCGRAPGFEVYTSIGFFEDWIRQHVPGAMFSE